MLSEIYHISECLTSTVFPVYRKFIFFFDSVIDFGIRGTIPSEKGRQRYQQIRICGIYIPSVMGELAGKTDLN